MTRGRRAAGITYPEGVSCALAASGRPESQKSTTDRSGACTGHQRLILEDFPSPKIARALSPNGRAHWATKQRARETVEVVVGAELFRQRLSDALLGRPVRITYRWVFPDRRRRDLDNHTTGVVKCVQDCLVRLGMISADDTSCVVGISTEIAHERGRRALEVTIRPALRGLSGEDTSGG